MGSQDAETGYAADDAAAPYFDLVRGTLGRSAPGMGDGASRLFVLIDKKRRGNTVQLRYGESRDDLRPFLLVVTPAYVAGKTGNQLPTSDDVSDYVETHAEELKTIAISKKERGFATETLL